MKKAFCILGLASLLAAATVVPGFAASDNASQATTGTQTGSQQVAKPATGSGSAVTSNQANQSYPATVGPTGSQQPDATNPNRTQPSGGGGGGKN
jgi:hypothetical protein